MGRKNFWFGTREHMQWVKTPTINYDATRIGWSNQTNFLNGKASVRRSSSAHKEYNLDWTLGSRDEIRAITDYAEGIFGDGTIHWADPFAMDKNLLPQDWASPFLGGLDGSILDGSYTRPMTVPTGSSAWGYPTRTAVYDIQSGAKPTVWIPVPPGFTAWVGVHGADGSGGIVQAIPTTGLTNGTPVALPVLSVATEEIVNTSFSSDDCDGILLTLAGSGTISISGIIVQVLKTGVTPKRGNFISGQGHGGSEFAEMPVLTQYSAALDKVSLTARMVETEQWL